MTSISRNVYKLDDIVNKYNNYTNSSIKMRTLVVKSRTHIDFDKENNKKAPK